MLRPLLVILMLIAPLAAHADDASVTAPAQSGSSLQQTGGTSAVPQTLNLLQPAGAGSSATALQSANAASGGVAQSASQALQQADASDQAKLLVQGEGDQPHQLSDAPDLAWLGYAVLILLAASAVTAAIWWVPRRWF